MDAANSITPVGKAKAEAELRHLKEVRRPEIVAAIKSAREFGDLKENAEYHAARDEQGHNESRIRVLEALLSRATVSEASSSTDRVGMGSRITYRDLDNDADTEVRIVHRLEADLAEGKISAESPIGRALIGLGLGEVAEFSTPRGPRRLEIVSISV